MYARMNVKFLLCAIVVLLLPAVSNGQAADPVERVYIQLGSPTRVPGVTLQPGTYIFMPGQPVAGQSIIEIYTIEGEHVATCLAIQSTLDRPHGATLIDYPDTRPPALRAWFHPGNARGLEFVYARDEAAAIFAASDVPVASTISDDAAASLVGVMPIVHADDLYRAGVAPDVATELGITSVPPGPIDRLTLARVAILGHLDSVPRDIGTRLKLLDSQIRDIHTAYRMGTPDLAHRISLARASLGNMPAGPDRNVGTFEHTPAITHVLERVRAQVEAFEALLAERAR